MEDVKENISIVVFGNKKDYFFTKICVASIRYFYPNIEIFLVKDKLNGNYQTAILRKEFNVTLLDLGKKYYGWGASKVHFILKKNLQGKRYLVLDSDIIFLGKVLDLIGLKQADFVVAPEYYTAPFTDIQKQHYVDPGQVLKYYSDYEYPGFFFNTGQMIVTPGIVTNEMIAPGYDPDIYPYYKDWNVFKTVDQSLLNGLLPVLKKRGVLSIDTVPFMAWSVTHFDNPENDSIQPYLDGSKAVLLHYCGDVRTYRLEQMKGRNLLQFFKKYYLERLSTQDRILDSMQDKVSSFSRLLNFNKWRNDKYIKMSKILKARASFL